VEKAVKPGVRAEHAALTRARILDAARVEFEQRGYAGTPVAGIARSAGVAVPTVYKVFTTKRNLLAQVVERAMTGAEYSGRVDEQPWWQEQPQEPDPERQLALIARNARRIYQRAGQILEVVRAAAALDPDIGGIWRQLMQQRAARSERTAVELVSRAGARARFSTSQTAVTLQALSAPELYTAQIEAGRTPDQYEQWLAAVLTASVLR
jgi:AcrR family transcriptional regulator